MPQIPRSKTLLTLTILSITWLDLDPAITSASAHLPDVATLPNPKDEATFDDKFFQTDRDATEITNTTAWKHPTKTVFARYGLKLTKVELMWSKKFPVFHIAHWTGGDPANYAAHSSTDDTFFTPLLSDLLTANAHWPYRIIADDDDTGFVVVWNAKLKSFESELIKPGNDSSP